MVPSLALAAWLGPPLPLWRLPLPLRWSGAPATLTAQQGGGSADRTRRFPLRREGGGTRGACAARLVAHLVPPGGQLDPGPAPILGLIEGDSPEPAPLVLRWPGGEAIEPARRGASLRLLLLPGTVGNGLWESFPACEGSAEPQAPPARSLLSPAPGAAAANRAAREALRALWRQCGQRITTATLLATWDYPHLADQLPPTLPVICATPASSGG